MAPWIRVVQTPSGPARLFVDRAWRPKATLVLGHGAGAGVETRDLMSLARRLPHQDVSVVRVEQPWVAAGRKVAPAPAVLDAAWIAALGAQRARAPLFVGGRSAGARVACRTARQVGAVGCVALAFPLHPPGKPEKSRAAELMGSGVPTLVVQGERDRFGTPWELPFGVDVSIVPQAGHDFTVPKSASISQLDAVRQLTTAVTEWILRQVS